MFKEEYKKTKKNVRSTHRDLDHTYRELSVARTILVFVILSSFDKNFKQSNIFKHA